MGAKRFLYGFLLGGAAAGLATLFTAPQAGRDTREALKSSKDTFISQLKDLKQSIMDVKDASAYATKEGRVHVSHFIKEVNTSIGRWKAETLPQQIEIQKEIKEIETVIGQLENELAAQSPSNNKDETEKRILQ